MKALFLGAAATVLLAGPAAADIDRSTFEATSDPDVRIAIREVVDPDATRRGDPLVLIHGARVPGVPSFDLPVEGGSLAADLARAGLAVYIVDLRGYGASTRPDAMTVAPEPSAPLVRSGEAVRDIGAAIRTIRDRTGADEVALLGWATGGHWAGMYAAMSPDTVSRVVFYNTLYGYTAEHANIGAGSRLSDPENPQRFAIERFRNYRLNEAGSLLPGWDRSIPVEDKSAWRDPAVAAAYVEAAIASDPTSAEREPPSFRAPSGALADSFLLATGAALWDARLTDADALIIRSENDFWSRTEDVAMLRQHLEMRDSGTVETLEIPQATHFVHLDRAERGRDAFLDAVVRFLGGAEG